MYYTTKSTKQVLSTEMGDLLATTDMGLKIGGLLCPFLG